MDAMVPGSASAIRLPATALPPGKSSPSRCPRPTAIKINGKPLTLQRCRRWPLFWFLDLLDLFVRLHWADLGATSLMGHGRDVLSEAFEFRLLTRGIETNKTGWLFSHCDYCGNLSQTPVRMSDPVTCTAWKLATEFKPSSGCKLWPPKCYPKHLTWLPALAFGMSFKQFYQPCRHSNICQNHTNYIYIKLTAVFFSCVASLILSKMKW